MNTSSMAPLTSIRATTDRLEIVNQLLLPHSTEFIEINSIEEAHDAIKSMKASISCHLE
jgi:methylthioribose-1-phosphate isomerase